MSECQAPNSLDNQLFLLYGQARWKKQSRFMKTKNRIETDSMGPVNVPQDAYWGAQTERARNYFSIGKELMPKELIQAITTIKKACAYTNCEYGLISKKKASAIIHACEEIATGKYDSEFPLSVWQTGSGTQTNMNVNEVIATLANKQCKEQVHPNDDVNCSQSTNDVIPSATQIACYQMMTTRLCIALDKFEKSLKKKTTAFQKILKVGRTHLMDATPLTLGQEFSGYLALIQQASQALDVSTKKLLQIPLGATAVGTGVNAPKGFSQKVCRSLCQHAKLPVQPAKNFFAELSFPYTSLQLSSSLKALACVLIKIANDIRWMNSGPRCGLSEITLPANEPGSSIMPGKVNPTQCEALIMVCIQCIANDSAITHAATLGNFELNVCRPIIAYNLLQSITHLADSLDSFRLYCLDGIVPNKKRLAAYVEKNLMHATTLAKHIGYEMTAKIVQKAHKEDISIKEAAQILCGISEDEFTALVML